MCYIIGNMTIIELIDGLELTDEALAHRLCVSWSTVQRWHKGRKVPTPHIRRALSKLAGVSESDVIWERARA
jgi:DNA-binding transcriptional regulator YiaG